MGGSYLVTGGAGFIGSHLVDAILAGGHRVRVLDDLSTGRVENLDEARRQIEFIQGDIRDLRTCLEACRGIDGVFHQAALPSVPRSIDDPLTTNEVNVNGTLNMLESARRAGVSGFVYASSSSVYGDTPELPKREDMAENPRSPYAASKLAGEKYCLAYHVCHGLRTVCLRYFNVYGPRQDPGSPYAAVIPLFIDALKRGVSPNIHGDGGQTRDFTFVEDVVNANLLAMFSENLEAGVFNIGGGKRYSILDLARTLIELSGEDLSPAFSEDRSGDVRDSQADIGKANRVMGYEPAWGLEAGLKKTL